MITAGKLVPADLAEPGRDDGNASLYGSLGVVVACLIALATLLFSGCSNFSQGDPVNAPQARDALKIALDAWKNGETSKSLASSSTPMTVQDFEWEKGDKLVDYEILKEGMPDGPNLRVQVKLTTIGERANGKKQAKPAEKTAAYVIGTSPRITVFRDLFRR
jgi:hypothetical protein